MRALCTSDCIEALGWLSKCTIIRSYQPLFVRLQMSTPAIALEGILNNGVYTLLGIVSTL